MQKTIAVVGLGLIGGSFAMGLKGFDDYRVIGVDNNPATLDYAIEHEVADDATPDAEKAIRQADITVLCLHPEKIVEFLKKYQNDFKPGSLVTDVCGVKTAIMKAAEVLPESVDFIGCHPMAGKETSGIWNADRNLFLNAHFILTPRTTSSKENVALMERMAGYIGCRDVVKTTPEEHDAIIAYTSQVMHIMAVAVSDDPDLFSCKGFEGGSFRDCTRVAALDVPLWTQLFSMNAPALVKVIRNLEDNLRSYREAVESGDTELLSQKLSFSADRKRHMNLE